MVAQGLHESIWMATCSYDAHAPLAGDIETDVAIIGGGIVGILTAAQLKESGLRVALIESRQLAAGVTGYTTAKLTAIHSTIYSKLQKHFGETQARLYAKANTAAIAWAE
jgi:glycine/D-amino acid oxidase-like deaminating enzyme